jgi:hypothetical protein
MTRVDPKEISSWVGRTAVDRYGDRVGKIVDVYLDDQTGQPEWLALSTGLFGTKVSFVPLFGASLKGDDVVISWSKPTVKEAPNAEHDTSLSPSEEQQLYEYYGRGDAWRAGGTMGTQERETGQARLRKWVDPERP